MHAGQLAVLSTRWPSMSVRLTLVAGTTPYNIYDNVRAHKRSVAFCRLMATPSPERLGHYTPDEETSVLLKGGGGWGVGGSFTRNINLKVM